MDTVLKEEQRTKNVPLISKNIRLTFLGVGVIIPPLLLGVLVGNNLMPVVANNPSAKGAAAAAILVVEISEITDSTAGNRYLQRYNNHHFKGGY